MATQPGDQTPKPTHPHAGDDAAHPVSQPEQEREDLAATAPLEDLARQHERGGFALPRAPRTRFILDDMRAMSRFLRDVIAQFRARPVQEPLSYAAEWMLDNFYLVEQSLRHGREDMPPG